MKPVIVADVYLHPKAITMLETTCRFIACKPGTEAMDLARRENASAIIPTPTWGFTAEVLDRLPNLLVIARPGIGVDSIDAQAATRYGVAVVNTPDGPTVSTAEHALSLLLALAKRHKSFTRILAAGKPLTTEPPVIELHGKVIGLVGLGRIGSKMAQICGMCLGMKVIAYDPYATKEKAVEMNVRLYADLFDMLRVADFVSIHCPVTDATRGLIGGEAFSVMKPTAYLINCARGVIVDESSLITALQTCRIAGAGLDVFDPEPPSRDNPLLTMENVIATPHSAGYTDGSLCKMGLGVAEEVLAVLKGDRPANLVNPEVWDSPARRKGATI